MTNSSLGGHGLYRVTIQETRSVLVVARTSETAEQMATGAELRREPVVLSSRAREIVPIKDESELRREEVRVLTPDGGVADARATLAALREAAEGRRRIEAKMPTVLTYSVERAVDGNGYPILELRKPAISDPLLPSMEVPKLLEAEGAAWVIRSETPEVVTYHQRGW